MVYPIRQLDISERNEIFRCAFCDRKRELKLVIVNDKDYHIECPHDGTRGPGGETIRKAIDAWDLVMSSPRGK